MEHIHENNLQVFASKEFGTIRTVQRDGQPWFVGKDIAQALGYSDTSDALKKHVDEEDKLLLKPGETPTLKMSNYGAYIINESGLYSLVLSSKLPSAKKFKRWVTSDVLPAIRKTGGYIPTEGLSDAEIMARALLIAQKSIDEKNAQIEQQTQKIKSDAPKVLFAESVTASHTSILIFDLAKLIQQNGVEIGGNRLFQWMRDNGYLVKRKGTDYNMPPQKAMEMGLFEVKETAVTPSDGHTTVNRTPKVTGRGQVYFINKFLRKMREEMGGRNDMYKEEAELVLECMAVDMSIALRDTKEPMRDVLKQRIEAINVAKKGFAAE